MKHKVIKEKEMPYFKHYVNDWLNGRIQSFDFAIQGLFINICCYAWKNKGDFTDTIEGMARQLRTDIATLQTATEKLHNANLIEMTKNDEIVSIKIKFVDEQITELTETHDKLALAGSRGAEARLKRGLSEAQARLKQSDTESESESDTKNNTPIAPKGARNRNDYPSDFLQFWMAYPKKEAKGDALKAWNQTKDSRPNLIEILNAVKRHTESVNWQKEGGQYIPQPARWLRSGRWDDEIEVTVEVQKTQPSVSRKPTMYELTQQKEALVCQRDQMKFEATPERVAINKRIADIQRQIANFGMEG